MRLSKIYLLILVLCAAPILTAAQTSAPTRTVKIYLPKYDSTENTGDLLPVERKVEKAAPLLPTMRWLFAPQITAQENGQGFGTATFGMRLVGVELRNGTALIKFSQPPLETDYGSTGVFTFDEAVVKTAKQFASVKRVKICAVGETQIDSELVEPFPRCPRAK